MRCVELDGRSSRSSSRLARPRGGGAALDANPEAERSWTLPTRYDADKNTDGRKHHDVTDTLGLLMVVLVTAASVQDRDAAGWCWPGPGWRCPRSCWSGPTAVRSEEDRFGND